MALFILVSGDAFYMGLGLTGFGAALALLRARLGVAIATAGVGLALASAVPLAPPLYGLLVVAFVAWVAGASRPRPAGRVLTGLLLGVTLVVALAGLLTGPSGRRSSRDRHPVFVLGDSLSAGLGADGNGTWPRLLAGRTGRRVDSYARAGARLQDGISQAKSTLARPCVVVIELGGNDILAGVSVGSFAGSLRELLQDVTRPGRSVVMFELPLLPLQNRFGRAQRRVCAELGVALIPRRILAGAVALPGHTKDGLHLSPAGHRWLAGRVAAWL